MPYTPPPPGSTEAGKPTPEGVPKQDAHIKDLPPEVRRSYLLSMVFFPSAVGAGICAVLFLGWWLVREPKSPARYAQELREGIRAGSQRSRWTVARELAENLGDPSTHDPEILGALLEIVDDPKLDEEVEPWSPSQLIQQSGERKTRLRWWAAYLAGHLGGVLNDPRPLPVLLKALETEDASDPQVAAGLRFFTAAALGNLKDLRAAPALRGRLAGDPDPGVRAGCAKSLGAIAWHHYLSATAPPEGAAERPPREGLEEIRQALRAAYQTDADLDVRWNSAIALARVKDETGRETLQKLQTSADPKIQGNYVLQRNVRMALELLDAK